MKSKSTAAPTKRRPRRVATGPEARLARHRAQCQICRHAQRDAIEGEFLDWVPGREIAEEYKLGSYRAVYRHAHALGLFRARRGHIARALEKIIERAGEAKITAASVVSAIRLLVKLETSFDQRSALAHLRTAAKDEGETRRCTAVALGSPDDGADWEEGREEDDRAPARQRPTGGAVNEGDADNGELLAGSAGDIFRELEIAHGLEPLPSPPTPPRSLASPESQRITARAAPASPKIQFRGASPKPSAPVEKKPAKPHSSAEPSPARAPAGPEPGTRREPDGPPNVAGMAWWPNGRSPFARRGRWGKRPVVD